MPHRASQLREVSTNGPTSGNVEGALRDAIEAGVSPEAAASQVPPLHGPQQCTLGIHDDSFSKLEVLVNRAAFPANSILIGSRLRISAPDLEPARQPYRRRTSIENSSVAHRRRSSTRHHDSKPGEISYVFVVQEIPAELLTRHPNMEISLNQSIASALGFKNRSQVSVNQVDEKTYAASHIEIAFRDEYLTRADMWRLVVSELAGKSAYKGQKLSFMTTIKAQVRAIYRNGSKRQSAFFGPDTKPVFRSESARYVLFVQMSREMWGFDTDGTGEVMFHKVVNGFLPELFRRWEDIGAHHLVSIVLFTRMEYDQPLVATLDPAKSGSRSVFAGAGAEAPKYRDFYRVVVSDMASGQWTAIIDQLKRNFKTFLRDVSITMSSTASTVFLGQDGFAATTVEPREIISGRPTAASQGNILEAINAASSQFSADFIDRDLIRTGLSIIVVTPGTGLFEVDHNILSLTTDVLIENGVSIDLVCLSRMPLHSVPLFKYRRQSAGKSRDVPEIRSENVNGNDTPLAGSMRSVHSVTSVVASSPKLANSLGSLNALSTTQDPWCYVVPHWVDVSFWTPTNPSAMTSSVTRTHPAHSPKKEFVPRIKMYEIQMMGIMEHELCNISIPYLKRPSSSSQLFRISSSTIKAPSDGAAISASRNRKSLEPGSVASIASAKSKTPSPVPQNLKEFGALFDWIDQHDDALFRHPAASRRKTQSRTPLKESFPTSVQHSRTNSGDVVVPPKLIEEVKQEKPEAEIKTPPKAARPPKAISGLTPIERPGSQKHTLTRQFSLGFRGLGGLMPKATPVTELSSANAHSESAQTRMSRSTSFQAKNVSRPASIRSTDTSQTLDAEVLAEKQPLQEPKATQEVSQPIAIRQANRDLKENAAVLASMNPEDSERIAQLQEKVPITKADLDDASVQLGISPRKALAPWLTVLNPCNPSSNYMDPRSRQGRWHHVFPRPLHASTMKWKSLCSPASVPLTTEEFSQSKHLRIEFEKEYTIHATSEGNAYLEGDDIWLIRELISARFCHGFQVIMSDDAATHFGLPLASEFSIFDDSSIGKIGAQTILSRGSSIHKLLIVDTGIVQVTIYTRRTVGGSRTGDDGQVTYRPFVRTTLSDEYCPREIKISSTKEGYDWQRLDEFIGNHEARHNAVYPSSLNFWRARYVLIPMKKPTNPKRRGPINEDDDEEIRLEGIRKITHLLQRHRYVPPEERRFEVAHPRKPEINALDIIYRTMKPSAIVAAELNVFEGENMEGKPAQLLPESELFERTKFNISNLAQTIQGEKGIRIMNRRWHWRLHYNCFIGLELTTWLVNNFRDIDTREEAEELGNELMKEGLFVHVEKRHAFRDGNFFYQIANEHLVRREAKAGWFGRSVPSTPAADGSRNGSGSGRPRSGANDSEGSDGQATPPGKQKLGAALSKSLVYEADRRHRSYRPELMLLHYDRISSADDCYHIRADWMNVTPKLIEDNVSNWASLAERNGLRLVELPIGAACHVKENHPFRGPYIVRLAKPPPEAQPQTFFDSTSLAPKASSKHIYHEAILKKFDFVLDLEAADDFPANVEVTYSWGKPDYEYPQYISRTGIILAQITREGDFLLLANRLYNNRTATTEGQRAGLHRSAASDPAHRQSPARQPPSARSLAPGPSPRASPAPSPMINAVPDVGVGAARIDTITPEKIKDQLEAFCSDVDALDAFYDELLRQTAAPGLMTPMMDSIVTSLAPPPLSLRDDDSTAS